MTLATGGMITDMLTLPDLVSLVAVIVQVPSATAVIKPVCDTVHAATFELAQEMTRLNNTMLPASRGVAVACNVWAGIRFVDATVTVVVATGA